MWWSGRSRALQAGEYRFDQPISPLAVVDKIASGDVYTQRLTFPEGLTIAEMAKVFESRGFGPARAFIKAAGDGALVKDLDAKARDLEGYLFPETYSLPRRADASRVVAMMVDRFRASYDDTLRARAEAQQLTTRQVVTLASLIEKETARADERPLVAAVYRNRIKQGMGMQADPTVVYALMKAGKYDGNIRREDLNFDSPYNTYRYPGLPPGPIAAPGPCVSGSGALACRRPVSLFRQPQRRLTRVRGDAEGAQRERVSVPGPVLPSQRAARASGASGRAGGPPTRRRRRRGDDRSVACTAGRYSTNAGALGSFACVAMSCSIHSCAPACLMNASIFARDALDCSALNSKVGMRPVVRSSG